MAIVFYEILGVSDDLIDHLISGLTHQLGTFHFEIESAISIVRKSVSIWYDNTTQNFH